MASSITATVTPSDATSWTVTTSATGWESTCASILNSAGLLSPNAAPTSIFVNGSGSLMDDLNNETWGITYDLCKQYCNDIPTPDFNFLEFTAAMTNYFLPWLSLCAQLPYETGDQWSNAMSFFLAVGSPALITYSLTITILNRYQVRIRFNKLHKKAVGNSVQNRYSKFAERIRCAQYLLQEAQQVPLRASQEHGWLSSLIVVPENHEWWTNVKERLSSTRRGVTPSLIAQILLAAIAYLFTVIASFNSSTLGDPSTALQISAGSLWVWLIPVILGWVTVGTQFNPDTIETALTSDNAHRALEPPHYETQYDSAYSEGLAQRGILPRSGITPQPYSVRTGLGRFETPRVEDLEPPSWLDADVKGDERRKGPIYNYARPFTWWYLASSIERALSKTLDNIDDGKACAAHPDDSSQLASWDTARRAEDNLINDSNQTSQYCGLANKFTHAYPKWAELPGHVWKYVLAASVMAIIVQWGTTGPSLLIADTTTSKGIGCRSAAYLLYGTLGTLVWLLLLTSMLLSHAAMLMYQQVYIDQPGTKFRRDNIPNRTRSNTPDLPPTSSDPGSHDLDPATGLFYTRTGAHTALCAAAVITRYIGKTLAIFNTLWLIVSTLMEYIGEYDNCWCKADVIGRGQAAGWVVMFKTTQNLARLAQPYWAGGVVTSILVCMFSYFVFCFGSWNMGQNRS